MVRPRRRPLRRIKEEDLLRINPTISRIRGWKKKFKQLDCYMRRVFRDARMAGRVSLYYWLVGRITRFLEGRTARFRNAQPRRLVLAPFEEEAFLNSIRFAFTFRPVGPMAIFPFVTDAGYKRDTELQHLYKRFKHKVPAIFKSWGFWMEMPFQNAVDYSESDSE